MLTFIYVEKMLLHFSKRKILLFLRNFLPFYYVTVVACKFVLLEGYVGVPLQSALGSLPDSLGMKPVWIFKMLFNDFLPVNIIWIYVAKWIDLTQVFLIIAFHQLTLSPDVCRSWPWVLRLAGDLLRLWDKSYLCHRHFYHEKCL